MGHHGSNLFTHLPSPPLSLPPFLSPLFLLSCPPPPSVISTRSSRGHPPPINVTPPPPPPPGAHRTRNNSPFVASPKRSIRYCQHLRPGSSALLHGGSSVLQATRPPNILGLKNFIDVDIATSITVVIHRF